MGDETEKAFKKVTTTHYFGRGAGLVKLVFEDGELVLQGLSERLEQEPAANAVEAKPAPQEARTDAPANGGKPWWKFW